MKWDSRTRRLGCQGAAAAAVVLAAGIAHGAQATAVEIRRAVRMLRRLERTCETYHQPNAHKLLNALKQEAVRLYEEAQYAPALDTILKAEAMHPDGVPRTYYGVQPGMLEFALRWPAKDEAALLPLDRRRFSWVMLAVTNLSEAKLDLAALRGAVECEGRSLTGADGKVVESLPPDDPALRKLLGPRSSVLVPPVVDPGQTVAFPVVFPVFRRWTAIRVFDEVNRIDARVKNYAEMPRNLAKYLRARKAAAAYRARVRRVRTVAAPRKTRPARTAPEYVYIGRIRNQVHGTLWAIRVDEASLARRHRRYFVRKNGRTIAELRRLHGTTGRLAEVLTKGYTPQRGEPVYVLERPAKPPTQPLRRTERRGQTAGGH